LFNRVIEDWHNKRSI